VAELQIGRPLSSPCSSRIPRRSISCRNRASAPHAVFACRGSRPATADLPIGSSVVFLQNNCYLYRHYCYVKPRLTSGKRDHSSNLCRFAFRDGRQCRSLSHPAFAGLLSAWPSSAPPLAPGQLPPRNRAHRQRFLAGCGLPPCSPRAPTRLPGGSRLLTSAARLTVDRRTPAVVAPLRR
jgi:hypothetical protein